MPQFKAKNKGGKLITKPTMLLSAVCSNTNLKFHSWLPCITLRYTNEVYAVILE